MAGLSVVSGRTFLVRWFRPLAVALEPLVTVVDNLGQRWFSDSLSVSDARRRFIVIICLTVAEIARLHYIHWR